MNSIVSIQIENFQSHTKTILEPALNGQLTVVVGQSDSGKSAALRALKWALYNSPQGADFIRVGTSFARVTVLYKGGQSVVRYRSNGGINRYIVNGETFEGFGNVVPLEVQQVTGVKPLIIGDLSFNLNMAEQLHGPFLGSSVSGGARAKVLGKLAGTEEIDLAGQQLGTDLFRKKQDEKRLSVELEEIDKKIAEYDYLPAMKDRVKWLENILAKVKDDEDTRNKLSELSKDLHTIGSMIIKEEIVICTWSSIEDAERLAFNIARQLYKSENLSNNKEAYLKFSLQIDDAQKAILKNIGIDKVTNIMSNLQALTDKAIILEINRLKCLKLNELLGSINSLAIKLIKLQSIENVEKLLIEIIPNSTTVAKLQKLKLIYSTNSGQMESFKSQVLLKSNALTELENDYKNELSKLGKCPICGNENIDTAILKEVL